MRKEPFDKEASNTLLPEAVGGGVRRPVLLKSQITHDIGLDQHPTIKKTFQIKMFHNDNTNADKTE